MKIKGSQRKHLRSLAHHLKPNVIVGKNKLSEGTMLFINESLSIHELIKVKFSDNEYKNQKKTYIQKHADCHIVGDIGKILILFRFQEDDEIRKIDLPI